MQSKLRVVRKRVRKLAAAWNKQTRFFRFAYYCWFVSILCNIGSAKTYGTLRLVLGVSASLLIIPAMLLVVGSLLSLRRTLRETRRDAKRDLEYIKWIDNMARFKHDLEKHK